MVEIEINLTISFLDAQLELHKIEFANGGGNSHLKVMNNFADASDLLKNMRTVLIGTTKELMRTKRELEEVKKQSAINESESYFYAKGVKFILTGTRRSENGKSWVHDIKNTTNNKTSEITDFKYLEIISKFEVENKHIKK